MKISRLAPARRGALAPLTALLLIPLLGMMAFAVDMGYITHTQNELQSAADAAALAGASQLTNNFVSYYLPGTSADQQATLLSTAESNAKAQAKLYAGYNTASGVSLTLLDGDIEFGYTDSSGNYTPCPTWTGYPNTVKVTLRRDGSANGPLGLFFGPVIGTPTTNLTAIAAATLYAGSIDGFNTAASNFSARLLPVTYDVNHWNNFIKTGQSPDGNTDIGSNGLAQLDVYPSLKFSGDFGELSLNQVTNGASTINHWINNGVSKADLQAEYSAGLLPLSSHNTLPAPTYTNTPPDWKGNPGVKDTTIQTAGDNVGQVYLLPLFKPVNPGVPDPTLYQAGAGSGANYYYTIVQFVGVTISSVTSGGSTKAITVQPTATISPDALFTNLAPAAAPTATSPLVTTFSAPRLTQ
jgi:Flp pilus assembly protein TadG